MKYCLIFLILFSAPTACAQDIHPKKGLAVSAGFNTIGSEIGYAFGLTTPYFNDDRMAVQVQYGQMQFSGGIPRNEVNYKSLMYDVLEVSVLYQLLAIGNFRTSFKTSGFY